MQHAFPGTCNVHLSAAPRPDCRHPVSLPGKLNRKLGRNPHTQISVVAGTFETGAPHQTSSTPPPGLSSHPPTNVMAGTFMTG